MLLDKISGFFSRKRKKPKSIGDLFHLNKLAGRKFGALESVKEKRAKYEADGLVANSTAEEHLYISLQECGCGRPCAPEFIRQGLETRDELRYDVIEIKCRNCGAEKSFKFDINRFFGDQRLYGVINPFDRPSSIIDIVEWLGLAGKYRRISEELEAKDKPELLRQSLMCIDEALKFYPPGFSYPPNESYFNRPKSSEPDIRRPRPESYFSRPTDTENTGREYTSLERLVDFKKEVREELRKLEDQ